MMAALGMLEVCGYSTALLACNKMLQMCWIKIIAIDVDKPAVASLDRIPLTAQVKFIGSIDAVQDALAIGRQVALKYNSEDEVIAKAIGRYHEGLEALIHVSKLQ